MNFHVPQYGNVIIDHATGDGFRTQVLPHINYMNSVVIAHKIYIKQDYQGRHAITVFGVSKLVESGKYANLETVFIDTLLPRKESKAFKALKKLCERKRIVFISHPHDLPALCAAMELLSVTKSCKLRTIKFNHYMHNRRW